MPGPHFGAQTTSSIPVLLNVYDLSPLNAAFLNHAGCGVHHSGVEINGTEYSFAGGAGVFEDSPRMAGGAVFSHQVEMGAFEGTQSDVKAAIHALGDADFGPDGYNVLTNNCNHFGDALCRSLVGVGVPTYVNRAAYFGSFLACLVPEEVLTGAPVGPGGERGGGGGGGFTMMGGGGREAGGGGGGGTAAVALRAFQGSGQSLSSGGGGSGSVPEEARGLLEKRERAREAAVKRFTQKQS